MFPFGELVSCVYHNRSDALIKNYLEGGFQLPDYETFVATLKMKHEIMPPVQKGMMESIKGFFSTGFEQFFPRDDAMSSMQRTLLQTLQNQYPQWMGLHNLPSGTPFMHVLKHDQLDLIVVDNYMDISPALKRPKGDPNSQIFINHSMIENASDVLVSGDAPLTTDESVRNFVRILRYFQLHQPKAAIVFLQFPYNLYPSKKRHQRCKAFEEQFNPRDVPGIQVFPPFAVVDALRLSDPQHYQSPQYAFYAGLVYQTMMQKNPRSLSCFSEREAPIDSNAEATS